MPVDLRAEREGVNSDTPAPEWSLEQVARMCGAEIRIGGADVAAAARRGVSGASIDTRTLALGEVFVALEGEHADGHRFARQALEQGAAAVLVRTGWYAEHGGELPPGAAALVAEDPMTALQQWGRSHRAAFQLPLIAVTGSNGKTTTRAMLGRILGRLGPVLATTGNLNNHLGVPLTLLRLRREHRGAAVEMGMSGSGEIAELCRIADPTSGVITNVGKAHLAQLGSIEAVGRAKSELADHLEARGGTTVLNADDSVLMRLNRNRVNPVRTFGIESQADVRAVDVKILGLEGSTFRIQNGPPVSLRLPGRHNVMNALAAAAAAETAGVDLDASARELGEFSGGEHGRLEPFVAGGVTVLDDSYNSNPLSVGAAAELLRATAAAGRKVAALGDMLELGPDAEREHRESGRGLGGLDVVWAVGEFASALAAGAREAGVREVEVFPDSAALAASVPGHLRRGDLVLVKGSRGVRMERVVEAIRKDLEK